MAKVQARRYNFRWRREVRVLFTTANALPNGLRLFVSLFVSYQFAND